MGKRFKTSKTREKTFGGRGVLQQNNINGGPSVKKDNKKRNISQLPRVLCRTRVSNFARASPWREVIGGALLINGMNSRAWRELPVASPSQWELAGARWRKRVCSWCGGGLWGWKGPRSGVKGLLE